jgi:tetraprenyl-beta-curcumene synthase
VRVRRWSSQRRRAHRGVSHIHAARALVHAVGRELTWGLRGCAREVARWRALAVAVPDDALRRDALEAIDHKRANLDGAVLFTTLAPRRSRDLLCVLVAFELLADYLDCTSERGAFVGVPNGLQLHRALIEALDPRLPLSDYYRYHPWSDDGGFLEALVKTCRETCVRLPSFHVVRPFIARTTAMAQVLPLNHEEDTELRDRLLRTWAQAHFRQDDGLAWFELTGGASAWLTVLALLALAADECCDTNDALAVYHAYLPWISLTGTLLDSYGDQDVDASEGAHQYVAHYASPEVAARRIGEVMQRSFAEASRLRHGPRHCVLVSSMAAMYLSKGSVLEPAWRAHTRALTRTAGSLTRLLTPALRTWRIVNRQQAR